MSIIQNTSVTTHKQTGLTLVELMVAMVISLLLIAGTITIFVSNKQAYRLNEASSRVQENGRFASSFIRRDVRMAGYAGCLSKNLGSKLNNIVDTSIYTAAESDIANIIGDFDGTNTIKGYTISSVLAGGDELYDNGLRTDGGIGDAILGTDAFAITFGESCSGGSVVQVMPGTAANLKIANAASCGIVQNSIAMVSDCEKADLFRVTSNPASGASKDTLAHANSINTSNVLSKAYGLDAEVFSLNFSIYYIGIGSSGAPSLFRRRYSGPAGTIINEELVEDIENMTVLYGVNTDSDSSANYYINATNVTAANMWPNVNSARIRIVARSDAQNVVQSTAIADRRLRHTFTQTIKIRNRI